MDNIIQEKDIEMNDCQMKRQHNEKLYQKCVGMK